MQKLATVVLNMHFITCAMCTVGTYVKIKNIKIKHIKKAVHIFTLECGRAYRIKHLIFDHLKERAEHRDCTLLNCILLRFKTLTVTQTHASEEEELPWCFYSCLSDACAGRVEVGGACSCCQNWGLKDHRGSPSGVLNGIKDNIISQLHYLSEFGVQRRRAG